METPPPITVRPTARQTARLYVWGQYLAYGTTILLALALAALATLGVSGAVLGWLAAIAFITCVSAMGLWSWWTILDGNTVREEMERGYTTQEQVRHMPDQSHLWLLDDDGNVLIPPGRVWF